MTAPNRIRRTDGTLAIAEMFLLFASICVFLARRRLFAAAGLLEETQDAKLTAEEEVQRLRRQLDGALEHIHEQETGSDQGGSLDIQGATGQSSLDSQGSPGSDPD